MALIPYEPFGDMDNFFNNEDWFFPVTRRDDSPEMDVYEDDSMIVAEISAPGMSSDDLKVSIDDGSLIVRGKKSEEVEDKNEDRGYYRKEIRRGSFERVVRLPSNTDKENVKASYEDGILKIEIPKTDKAEREKRIEIESK